jgi:hypothetical protein
MMYQCVFLLSTMSILSVMLTTPNSSGQAAIANDMILTSLARHEHRQEHFLLMPQCQSTLEESNQEITRCLITIVKAGLINSLPVSMLVCTATCLVIY